MFTNQKSRVAGRLSAISGIRYLSLSALFVAMSMALKALSFTAGPFRIGFENLPVLMAGIFMGPFAGALVGAIADIIGCVLVGYTINPIITVGAAAIGITSGVMAKSVFKGHFAEKRLFKIIVCVFSAHFIGSMLIKSFGMYVYFNFSIPVLLLRIPQSLILGSVEAYIIYILLKNRAFANQLETLCKI